MKLLRPLIFLIAIAGGASGLRAQIVITIPTSTGSFSGSEQVIDFNVIANLAPISTDYASLGVTFSPGLLGTTNGGDTSLFPSNGGGVIANNDYGATTPALTWTAMFSAPEGRAGFLVEMNTSDSVRLTTSLGGTTHGSVTYTSLGITPVFFGVQDTGSFDTITFTVAGPNNHFFAMDDFRYEVIPEPPVTALLAAGLLGLVGLRRWRRA